MKNNNNNFLKLDGENKRKIRGDIFLYKTLEYLYKKQSQFLIVMGHK